MATRSLPPALAPYLSLPPETSLILLTSTLSCSVNWLTARFIANISRTETDDKTNPPPMILVGWLHDETFWRNEVKRVSGTSRTLPFTFIDCFSSFLTLSEIERSISSSISKLRGADQDRPPPILILDAPDTLLATTSTTSSELNSLLLRIRSDSHAVILSCSADLPLISAATSQEGRPPPLEIECANFIVSQAHAARLVMSVRELETGAAKDVSGVLRVTRGGGFYDFDGADEKYVKESEMLYLVQRDGNAKVFERGSGMD